MKRESLVFLLGGFAFGILVGFALFHALQNPPSLDSDASARAGMGSVAGSAAQGPPRGAESNLGGAPMVKRINQLRRELAQDPQDMAAAVELADLYQRAGIWEQAVDYYEQALEIEPDHPQLLVNLGLCYRGLQRYDDALEAFNRAYRLDSENWESLFNTVVVAALDLQRYEAAMDAMEALEALPAVPGGPEREHLKQLRAWLVATRTGS